MKLVTDPELLAQLEGNSSSSNKEITDPELLRQLNGEYDPAQNDGVGSKVLDFVMRGGGIPGNPIDVAQRVYKGVTKAFEKGGEITAESLGEKGVDPRIAAGVGTTVSMVPDLASGMLPAGPAVKGSDALGRGAKEFSRRALGFSKAQLKTPFARGQAAKAAEIALQENILPKLGNRDDMARRAFELKQREGKRLGDIRESVGPQKIDDVFNSLEDLKNEIVGDKTGGVWDGIRKRIESAQESIIGLTNKNEAVPLKEVERAKKEISDTVNFLADNASQKTNKQVVRSIERGVEKTLSRAGADLKAYRTSKEKFGAAKKMMEGIDNARSAEEGNNLFGPIASITGISQAATGNLPGAAASLGLVELLKRRGSSSLANLLATLNPRLVNATASGHYTSPLISLLSQSLSDRKR